MSVIQDLLGMDSLVFKILLLSPYVHLVNTIMVLVVLISHLKQSIQHVAEDGISMLLVHAVFLFQQVLHHVLHLNIGMETIVLLKLWDTSVFQDMDGMEMFVFNIQLQLFVIQDIITMVEIV